MSLEVLFVSLEIGWLPVECFWLFLEPDWLLEPDWFLGPDCSLTEPAWLWFWEEPSWFWEEPVWSLLGPGWLREPEGSLEEPVVLSLFGPGWLVDVPTLSLLKSGGSPQKVGYDGKELGPVNRVCVEDVVTERFKTEAEDREVDGNCTSAFAAAA